MAVLGHLVAKIFVQPHHVLRYIIPLSFIGGIANKLFCAGHLLIGYNALK